MTGYFGQRGPLLCSGRNCWTLASCGRLAFLIDGKAYFDVLLAALPEAKRRIVIVGWDFDSRTPLRPDHANDAAVVGNCLRQYVEARPTLDIYLLIWRNSIFYGSNPLPLPFGSEWWNHPRIHFKLDDHHPVGASHHQKLVCIDDNLAFLGGMDVTQGRWDDPAHVPDRAARTDTSGRPYPPVHDVQAMVNGEAARAVAAIAGERWRCLTGERLQPVSPNGDPWPDAVPADLVDCTIAVARTQPAYGPQPEAREVDALTLDLLSAAERFVYIETQYFALPSVADILVRQLARRGGPEIVIVVTCRSSGVVEQYVMAENRDRLLAQLHTADRHGRLRTYFSVSCSDPLCEIKIHSKVVIVDDDLLRIGSSNLNSRSVGLDTECDLAIEAESDAASAAIRGLRSRLLAEHVGADVRRFDEEVARTGSLIAAIEALNGGERRLMPFAINESAAAKSLTPGTSVLDPPQPIDLGYVWGRLTSSSQ